MSEKEAQRITRRTTTSARRTTAPKRATASSARRAPSHEDIARRAYELFEARGGLHGHHLEDWLCAETELTAR